MFGSKSKPKKNEKDPFSAIESQLNNGGLNDIIEDVDMGQIDKLMKNDIKEDEIQLTDADMDDPDLLAQLNTIESGSKLEKPKPPPKPSVTTTTTIVQQQQQTTTTVKSAAPQKKKVLTQEEEEELMLKRELGEVDDDDDNNSGMNEFEEMIPVLEERMKQYKLAALTANRAGDIETAKNLMRELKKIDYAINEIKDGSPIDVRTIPPELNQVSITQQTVTRTATATATKTTSPPRTASPTFQTPTPVQSPKIEIMSREKVEQEERNQTWELFEEEFKKKHHFLTTEALKYKNIDKTKAISLLRESKGIHAILDQIEANRHAGLAPPPYHFEEVVTQNEVINHKVKENDIEISIGKYEFPKSFGTLDTFIQADFPYPSSEYPTKLTTGTSNSNSSKDYGFTTTISMDKKKTFVRVAEKKKLQLSIISSRMFFMKSLIGKCEIKLSPLMSQCEITEKAPILKEGSKKELGGYVEVTIRLRTPLDSKQVEKKVEKVLRLDGPFALAHPTTTPTETSPQEQPTKTLPEPVKPTPEPVKPTPEPKKEITAPPTQPTQPTPPPKKETPTPQAQPAKPAAASVTPKQEEDDEEEDIESVDRIVSNDVMESVLDSINKQIAAGSKSPDLLDKKQAIELKLMVLETQVSSGMLTIETYTKQIEEAILKDKILAKKLVGEGKKDKAMIVMQRVKIMTKELEAGEGEE